LRIFEQFFNKKNAMKQYLIHAKDYTDAEALPRRMANRPAHFEGAKALKARGNFVMGGAMLNDEGAMIGSTIVLQFETQAEFDAWYASEPYITGKVWENVAVFPFKLAVIE
jgi:uncharacterized protein YciI